MITYVSFVRWFLVSSCRTKRLARTSKWTCMDYRRTPFARNSELEQSRPTVWIRFTTKSRLCSERSDYFKKSAPITVSMFSHNECSWRFEKLVSEMSPKLGSELATSSVAGECVNHSATVNNFAFYTERRRPNAYMRVSGFGRLCTKIDLSMCIAQVAHRMYLGHRTTTTVPVPHCVAQGRRRWQISKYIKSTITHTHTHTHAVCTPGGPTLGIRERKVKDYKSQKHCVWDDVTWQVNNQTLLSLCKQRLSSLFT